MEERKQPRRASWQQLLETLRQLVPPEAVDFRDEQKAVIGQIRKGRDVLAVMPTGGGKSICYQVPAMHLPGITLVISPLLALMEDQCWKLYRKGFPVACLSSAFILDHDGFHRSRRGNAPDGEPDGGNEDNDNLSPENDKPKTKSFKALRNQIFLDACEKKYKLLYVTPERLRDGHFIRFAQKVEISMIAVDEAHCISLWGYDFRPRYLEISRLLTRIGYHPIIAAFTATAAKSVREDIVKLLGMKLPKDGNTAAGEGEGTVFSVQRDNLTFSVRHIPDEKGMKKRELLRCLKKHSGESGFVYCSRVDYVNEVWQYLCRHGIAAARYYAGLDDEDDTEKGGSKQENFNDFMVTGKKTVIVSTTALGMGIDKSDIRFVVHYNLPTCLENYYQEAGRAGRDGFPAECVLYYTREDIQTCRGLLERAVEGSELSEEERKWHLKTTGRRLSHMIEYAERGEALDSAALQQRILDYFRGFDPYDGVPEECRPDVLSRLRRTDVLYVNRTKIAQELRKGRMAADGLAVGRKYNGLPAPRVSYRVTGGVLDYFDLMVADAVYTLMKHCVPTIYAKTVYDSASRKLSALTKSFPRYTASVNSRVHQYIIRGRCVLSCIFRELRLYHSAVAAGEGVNQLKR